MNPAPASDNNSKYEPTDEASFDTVALDPEDGLTKLLEDCIRDIYWAENHLVMSLPKMAQAASNADLQQAILNHLGETKTHVERLEQAFDILGKTPQAKKCDAMEGLSKEGEAVIETTDMGTPARNLGIIMASQKVEHYEIASYRGIIKLSDSLGYAELSSLLSETLAEEENADDLLATISDKVVSADGPENNN
jgi:ferritin-like metal-binding protein YciE